MTSYVFLPIAPPLPNTMTDCNELWCSLRLSEAEPGSGILQELVDRIEKKGYKGLQAFPSKDHKAKVLLCALQKTDIKTAGGRLLLLRQVCHWVLQK